MPARVPASASFRAGSRAGWRASIVPLGRASAYGPAQTGEQIRMTALSNAGRPWCCPSAAGIRDGKGCERWDHSCRVAASGARAASDGASSRLASCEPPRDPGSRQRLGSVCLGPPWRMQKGRGSRGERLSCMREGVISRERSLSVGQPSSCGRGNGREDLVVPPLATAPRGAT